MNYGPRLSADDYQRAIVQLYTSPGKFRDRKVLDLTIDHRLGIHFPIDRRDQLWRVQRRIRRCWPLLYLLSLFRRCMGKATYEAKIEGVADYVLAEYATVLSDDEMRAYFGDS